MSEIIHPPGCACGAHDEASYTVSRRQAIKSLGALGAGLTLGPTVAMGALGGTQQRE
jgi:hypothetical protein